MKTLKDKKVIDRIFKEGDKISTPSIYAKFIEGNSEILISVPVRLFKRAVHRNRIKRLLRESIRTKKIGNYSIALVYNKDEIDSFSNIEKDVEKIFNKLNFSTN